MTAVITDSWQEARARMKRERSAGEEMVRGRAAEQKMIGDLLGRAQQGVGG